MPDHISGKTITFRHAVAIYMTLCLEVELLFYLALLHRFPGPLRL
ncbi:MAG: hypothetical protein ACYCT2_07450 [Thermoplasmataceae archaeon]